MKASAEILDRLDGVITGFERGDIEGSQLFDVFAEAFQGILLPILEKPFRQRYEVGEKQAPLELFFTSPVFLKVSPWLQGVLTDIAMTTDFLEIAQTAWKKARRVKPKQSRDIWIFFTARLMALFGPLYTKYDHKQGRDVETGVFDLISNLYEKETGKELSPERVRNIYYKWRKMINQDSQLQRSWRIFEFCSCLNLLVIPALLCVPIVQAEKELTPLLMNILGWRCCWLIRRGISGA